VDVTKAAVIGCGVMGSGIAQTFAQHGFAVTGYEPDEGQRALAWERVTTGPFGIEHARERGKLTVDQAEGAVRLMSFVDDLEAAVDGAGIVIECVPERLALKVETFRRLDAVARPGVVLASNTSGFPIEALAAATGSPGRVIGWHWASPAVVSPMAEVVVTPATEERCTRTVTALAEALGKHPVVVRDQPMVWGFVGNRVIAAALREAERVVAEGVATREQVDQLLVDGWRWPVGPFTMVRGASSGWDDAR
jgi:3-hydroxybutyryl-CoA dehydrogenase